MKKGHCVLSVGILLGFDYGPDFRLGGLVPPSSISTGLD